MNEPTIQQLFDLNGKVALITGGTGWLGSAMARGLAEAGARVVVGSREEQRAQAAADELPGPSQSRVVARPPAGPTGPTEGLPDDVGDLRSALCAGSGDPRTTGSGDPRTTGSGDPRTTGTAADALPGPSQSLRPRHPEAEHADGGHIGVRLDHMDEASLAGGFAAAVERAGQVDVLINNGHEALAADWRAVTGEEFTRQLANATGYFLLARLFRDHIVERKAQGSVVLLGSMYGLVGSYPDAYEDVCPASPAAYHALKGGIIHLTRHLAVYWAKDGVRVNCLSPGPFPPPRVPGELVERLSAKSPLGRMGEPHELKGAAVFLASDASSYMTGQNLVIDGGWTAW